MWGRGPRGNNGACSALCWISVTPSATQKQIGPFWCCFPCGWACVRCRTLWVSPTNSSVRLGVSPTATSTPTGVFNQQFEALFPGAGALGFEVCFAPQLFLLLYQHVNVGLPSPQSTASLGPPTAALPRILSTPPTGLGECFFFISLVVRLPHSLIFCQYWLFSVFKLLLSFFWLCEEAQCGYLLPPPGWKS